MSAAGIHVRHDVLIENLTPLHIGSGEVFEPTSFFVDEKRNVLTEFDPLEMIESLDQSQRAEVETLCREASADSLLRLMKFIRKNVGQVSGREIQACAGFLRKFRQGLKQEKQRSGFEVAKTAFDRLRGRPYLPGSAIKGAIRTAVLQKRSLAKPPFQVKNPKKDGQRLQNYLLDFPGMRFQADPFRLLKVSDFIPIGTTPTKIDFALNYGKGAFRTPRPESTGPDQVLEVIPAGQRFLGSIQVLAARRGDAVKSPLSWGEVTSAIQSFYQKHWTREWDILRNVPRPCRQAPEWPLRLGLHCGAECVTVEPYRTIYIPQSEQWADEPNTLWLAAPQSSSPAVNFLQPLGWTRCTFLTPSQAEQLRSEEAAYSPPPSLSSLSPLERQLAEIDRSQDPLGAASQLFNRLDDFPPEDRLAVARKIQQVYNHHDKWKTPSRKFKKRVATLKELLGES